MALDPVPVDLVALRRRVEPAPEVLVLDRLLVGGAPAVALPAGDPARDAAAQILRVGVQIDVARALQRLQRCDRRHQLHAVVGGERLAAAELLDRCAAAAGSRPSRPGPGCRSRRRRSRSPPGSCAPAVVAAPRPRPCGSAASPDIRSGSFGFTSAPGGTLSQSTSRVSMKRSAAPRASIGSASTSSADQAAARR